METGGRGRKDQEAGGAWRVFWSTITSPRRAACERRSGDVQDSEIEAAAVVVQMPGNDERHRESAERGAKATGQCYALAYASMVERWVASAWLLTEKRF